jgi:hypothetical protein
LAASVEDGVKALHEGHAADKVHPGDLVPDVSHDEVYAVLPAADDAVQRAGPRLSIRSQLERAIADDEEERLEFVIMLWEDPEEAGVVVVGRVGLVDVVVICVWGKVR